jgi:tRNA nucleotidyltransferase (CCA-adding enzyme)
MNYPKILKTISDTLKKEGAKAIIVGGSVRDHFLGIEAKDFDIEVYGLENLSKLEDILKKFGRVELVGKSFGVLKFIYQKEVYDFSFPRSERKVASGHKGFDILTDGFMDYKEASRRRDFTINSMGYDIDSGEFLDPYDGKEDLKRKILRHIDDTTFVEDPLRLYRGIQFCARFDLQMADETKELCRLMVEQGVIEELSSERVYEEFVKLLLKSDKPSIGFNLMRELGVLRYFPELEELIGIKQDPLWHPEGDVWIHTMMVIDEASKLRVGDDRDDLILMFASLCHDFGKVSTTEFIDGRIRSRGHEKAGVLPTKRFLERLTKESSLIDEITPIVANHLAPSQLFKDNSSKAAIRRLATRVNISKLIPVAKADFFGRDLKEARSGEFKAGDWLEDMARDLEVSSSKPKMILQGRDLISLGLEPSSKFKKLLDAIYELQLDGKITTKDEAIKEVKKLL